MNTLKVDGYGLIRADNHGNMKRGEACLYYKEKLDMKTYQNEIFPSCSFVVIYMLPNQFVPHAPII